MSLATAQDHHREAEKLHHDGQPTEKVTEAASLAIAGYLEELVLRLGAGFSVASLPEAGDSRPVRAI